MRGVPNSDSGLRFRVKNTTTTTKTTTVAIITITTARAVRCGLESAILTSSPVAPFSQWMLMLSLLQLLLMVLLRLALMPLWMLMLSLR